MPQVQYGPQAFGVARSAAWSRADASACCQRGQRCYLVPANVSLWRNRGLTGVHRLVPKRPCFWHGSSFSTECGENSIKRNRIKVLVGPEEVPRPLRNWQRKDRQNSRNRPVKPLGEPLAKPLKLPPLNFKHFQDCLYFARSGARAYDMGGNDRTHLGTDWEAP